MGRGGAERGARVRRREERAPGGGGGVASLRHAPCAPPRPPPPPPPWCTSNRARSGVCVGGRKAARRSRVGEEGIVRRLQFLESLQQSAAPALGRQDRRGLHRRRQCVRHEVSQGQMKSPEDRGSDQQAIVRVEILKVDARGRSDALAPTDTALLAAAAPRCACPTSGETVRHRAAGTRCCTHAERTHAIHSTCTAATRPAAAKWWSLRSNQSEQRSGECEKC